MSPERFDIIVFGGGKAGKTLAMDQARAGRRVAMVERGLIGGSCINVACIPSKTLIRSAQIRALVDRSGEFGVQASTSIDMAGVARRTASVVAEMVAANQNGFDASGLELIKGWGRFVDARVIEVETAEGFRRLTAPAIYLNTGTRADVPDIKGLVEALPATHVEALSLADLPEHLIVLGAGYIGLELGQAFRRLGAAVTIVEQGPQIAGREDADVSSALRAALEEEGVSFKTGVPVTEVAGRSGQHVSLTLADGTRISGSHLLVATGRRPMTDGIGLELAGVDLDSRGFVKTDDQLRTTAAGIWALGEIAGTPMFTHASLDDYRVIKSVMAGTEHRATGRLIPYCVFTDPELGRVGLSERQAGTLNLAYRVFVLPMDVVPRARTLGERKGFMKAVVGPDDRILGFAMVGAQAGEVMTVVHMAMLGGLTYMAIRDAIIAHPTLSEGLGMLFATTASTR